MHSKRYIQVEVRMCSLLKQYAGHIDTHGQSSEVFEKRCVRRAKRRQCNKKKVGIIYGSVLTSLEVTR